MDPFCGSGTTIVESFMHGHDSIGNDLNPLSLLQTKVKTSYISRIKFSRSLESFTNFKTKITDRIIRDEFGSLPKRKLSSLLTNENMVDILTIRGFIKCQNDSILSSLYNLGLSAVLWNMFDSRKSPNIRESFVKKLISMHSEILRMNSEIDTKPNVILLNENMADLEIEKGSIDIIITSPPYVNALDYHRCHMYNMHFLGYDFKGLRKLEIGSHSKFVHNRFRLLSEYAGDMFKFMYKMNHALKNNRYCVVVLGTSTIEFEKIDAYKLFEKFAHMCGFDHKRTYFRNMLSTKKYTNSKIANITDEQIVVLQKTSNARYSLGRIHNCVDLYMHDFLEQIKKNPGSSVRYKKPTKARLRENQNRVAEAIENIRFDI